MFPGPHDRIIRNEAGEVIGWETEHEPDPNDWADEYEDWTNDDED